MDDRIREHLNRQFHIGSFTVSGVWLLYLLGMTVLGIVIRGAFLPYVSQDYTGYWEKWFAEIHRYGGMASLSHDFYDYAPTFMYFLVFIEGLPFDPMISYKVAMCLLDVLLAVACGMLAGELTGSKEKGMATYGLVFLLPTVMANSALWCQCDVTYTLLIMLFLYNLIREKPLPAMIFYGLSFCLKLQTLFIFPALVVFWVHKKIKAEHFFTLPVLYVLSVLPAVFFGGCSFLDMLLVYVRQGSTDVWALTLSWPNIYQIIGPEALIQVYSGLGKCLILVILMCTMYDMSRRKYRMTPRIMVEMVLFYAMITVYFLPFMHERYGYLADVLTVLYAVLRPKRFYVPMLHVLISCVSYMKFLTKESTLPMVFYAFLLLFLLATVGMDLYRDMQRERMPEKLTEGEAAV